MSFPGCLTFSSDFRFISQILTFFFKMLTFFFRYSPGLKTLIYQKKLGLPLKIKLLINIDIYDI